MKLSEIVDQIGGKLDGDGAIQISGVAGIKDAQLGEISFIANPKYAPLVTESNASAVIVSKDWSERCTAALIRVANPDEAFAKVAMFFYTPPPKQESGVHPSAVVANDVKLGEGVKIGPLCVIESGAEIGANTTISAQCYIGHNAKIGADCFLRPQVSVRESVILGDRVILHNGAVVGSDGFGYSVDENGIRTKIDQIGTVVLGDDVEIGANVTIDRARFGKTSIGKGTKVDNLVQIAHNVKIGEHAVIISQAGIAGSTSVGNKAIVAGQAGLAGHVKIGEGAIVGAQAGVTKDVAAGEFVMGFPAQPASKFKRMQAGIMFIPKLKQRIAALEKKSNS